MIQTELFKHQWLKTFRAPGYYKNLTVNILLGFFALYMSTILIVLGFNFPKIIQETTPQYSAAEAFNGMLIYVVLGALMIRYFMQTLNSLNLQPYQVLPVKRNTLVNYVLLKPLLNPVNYVTLLFAVPFSITGISKTYGIAGALGFLILAVFLIWFNTLFASYLKRKFGSSTWGSIGVLAFIGIIVLLEYLKVFSLFDVSRRIFDFILSSPLITLSVFILPVAAYLLNKLFFANNYYAENFNEKVTKKRTYDKSFSFMERFGKQGELMLLNIKLILRNKRTKSTLYVSLLFLLYGLMFYSDLYQDKPGFLFFAAMIITGALMLMFGQWIISWNGPHFDALMTKGIDARDYVKANYNLMMLFNIVSFIVTTPYFLYGKEIITLQIVAFLYNMGVNTFLLLFFATFNTKRLELNQGSAMNYQGTTYKNFLIVIPIMIGPMVVMGIASLFSATQVILWIFAALGILGILFSRQLISLCVAQFLRRKYAMCEGFRKKE